MLFALKRDVNLYNACTSDTKEQQQQQSKYSQIDKIQYCLHKIRGRLKKINNF